VGGLWGGSSQRIHVSFRLSDIEEIKWDLGRFIDDSDEYIQDFIIVIQTFELPWKDVMLLLDQAKSLLLGHSGGQ
jgi:hypothetical protein